MMKRNSVNFYVICALLTSIFIREGSSEYKYVCESDHDGYSLTCSTSANGTSIEWLIILPDGSSTESRKSVFVSRSLMLPIPTEFFVNNTHFQFSKLSNSPLTSTLLIYNVSRSVLDGATVNCMHQGGTTSTFIRVIEGVPNSTVTEYAMEYSANNVTVQFEYSREPYTTYNVTVLDLTTSASRTFDRVQGSSIQFSISYNIVYRVSFVASHCGLSSTNDIILHYVKCDPLKELQVDDSALVTGYSDPALVGTNITISCPVGDGHTGNVTMVLTCMNDGQWDPDPQLIGCAGHKTAGDTTPSVAIVSTINSNGTGSNTVLVLGLSIGTIIAFIVVLLIVLFSISIFVVNNRHNIMHKAITTIGTDKEFPTLPHREKPDNSQNDQRPDNNVGSGTDPNQNLRMIYADIVSQPSVVNMTVDDNNRVEYAQIKIQTSSSVKNLVSNKLNGSADDSLDLDCLLIQINPEVTSSWYKIGQALGIEKKLLDSYLSYPPEQNIIEVCDSWLRNHTGKPTWREVAEALRQIGFQEMAHNIEKVYETGVLPKEFNMNVPEEIPFNDEISESAPPVPPRLC